MNETQTIAQLFDLSGKAAVVTGGAMGIGRAIVFRLTEAGAAVMIADLDQQAASKTVEQIRSGHGKAESIVADARSSTDAVRVMEATRDAFGSVEILVNNAGVYPVMPFVNVKDDIIPRWWKWPGLNPSNAAN